MITIHDPTPALLASVAARLCPEDLAELSVQGHDPLSVMHTGWQTGRETYVACWDGQPQAVCGVADYLHDNDYGVPWMLSTGPRGRVVREFLEVSRQFIADWSPMYRALFNLVDARHLRAQRWLRHLGFEPYTVHDLNGHPFIEFGRIDV